MKIARILDVARVGASRSGCPTWRIHLEGSGWWLTKRGSQIGYKVDESWKDRVVSYETQYLTREGTRIVAIEPLKVEGI